MYRRVVLGAVATALLGLLGGAGAARAEDKPAEHKDHLHGQAARCARACADCMLECESCAHHCAHLVAEGKKDHLRVLGTCADCGELCASAAKVVARHGPLTVTACEACASACDACAAECDRCCAKSPDEHMKACAKACRDCAKACRDMIKHAGHHDKEVRK